MKTKCLFLFVALVVLGQLAAIPLANASSQHLRCYNGYSKVATYSSSILCQKQGWFSHKSAADAMAAYWATQASCNAHRLRAKSYSARKGNRYLASAWFKCANIN